MSEVESTGDILGKSDLGNLPEVASGESKKNGWGGRRPNQNGRPKGSYAKKTLEAMKVREAFRQRVLQHADDLFNAQFDLAVGEKVLMVKIRERDAKGKILRTYFEEVTDKEKIKQYLDWTEGDENTVADDPNDDEHFYFITTKASNNQALEALLNRGLGKVADKLEVEGDSIFTNPQLTIKVVGSDHGLEEHVDISADGQLPGGEDKSTSDDSNA